MRVFRFVWPLVFFIPLGDLAGRYCWVVGIDPLYHALVFTHEFMPQILLAYALLSAAIVVVSDARGRERVRQLASFASPKPTRLAASLAAACAEAGIAEPACTYIAVPQSFCFAAGGRAGILVSSGFIDQFTDDELRLALQHEAVHVHARHAEKALAWRIGMRLLVLPGFRAIERFRHARREEIADRVGAGVAVERYRRLLVRAAVDRQSPLLAFRLDRLAGRRSRAIELWPALAAGIVLIALVSSHFFFLDNAAYLMSHHC